MKSLASWLMLPHAACLKWKSPFWIFRTTMASLLESNGMNPLSIMYTKHPVLQMSEDSVLAPVSTSGAMEYKVPTWDKSDKRHSRGLN